MNTVSFLSGSKGSLPQFDFLNLEPLRAILSPTIFVGLGGGGSNAVNLVKELVQSTLAPHTPENAPVMPEAFQFVAFDSASSRPGGLVPGEEWVQLDGSGLGHGAWDEVRRNPAYSSWLSTDVSYSEFATGCQGFRNLGKFLFHKNINLVRSTIQAAINRATRNLALERSGRITFVIFCTLAGGTGSGCVLDCSFLLRQMYPDFEKVRIWGLLACAEGFAEDESLNDRAKSGTYSALKELDHFMSSARREEWIDMLEATTRAGDTYVGSRGRAQRGVFQFPNSSVQGRYEKPFDWCFLLGHENSKGVRLANDSPSFSAIMARIAISLCTYPPVHLADDLGAGGQDFKDNANNITQDLAKTARGASVCYIVPGLVGAHMPVEQVFDLLTLQSARRLLDDMRQGTHNDEDMVEAQDFVSQHKLHLNEVREFIKAKLIRMTGDDAPTTDLTKNEALLKSGKRYRAKAQIFKPFKSYLEIQNFANRTKDRKKTLWAQVLPPEAIVLDEKGERDLQQSPLTIGEGFAKFGGDILGWCNAEIRTVGRRRAAVEDFLSDLNILINELLREADNEAARTAKAHQTQSELWKNDPFHKKLEDYTTKEGFGLMEMDFLLRSAIRKDYSAYAGRAFQVYQERLVGALSAAYVREMRDQLVALREQVTSYFRAVDQAREELLREERGLIKELHGQEEARGQSMDNAFSINLMSAEWRQAFVAQHKLSDIPVLESIATGNSSADQPWRPFAVLTEHASPEANPAKEPLAKWIASDVCGQLFPWFKQQQDIFSQWDDGKGLEQTLALALPGRQQDGYERAGGLLIQKCNEQWDVSLNSTKLETSVRRMRILAGPQFVTGKVKSALSNDRVSALLTYEAKRLNMITFAYPVGLAGCPRVYDPLRPAYDRLISNERTDARATNSQHEPERKYHCFPKAWDWQEPLDLIQQDDKLIPEFSTLLLAGLLPMWSAVPKSIRDFWEKTLVPELNKAAPTPREKGIALFSPDGASWWLCPFGKTDWTRGTAGPFEPSLQIGSELESAFRQYASVANYLTEGRKWVDWWNDQKKNLLNRKEQCELLAWAEEWAQRQRDRIDPTEAAYRFSNQIRKCFEAEKLRAAF